MSGKEYQVGHYASHKYDPGARLDFAVSAVRSEIERLRAATASRLPPLSDEFIDRIAEKMPGGIDGFLKGWGWRQFARAIESAHGIGEEAA